MIQYDALWKCKFCKSHKYLWRITATDTPMFFVCWDCGKQAYANIWIDKKIITIEKARGTWKEPWEASL